jgi:hypothetical protein
MTLVSRADITIEREIPRQMGNRTKEGLGIGERYSPRKPESLSTTSLLRKIQVALFHHRYSNRPQPTQPTD